MKKQIVAAVLGAVWLFSVKPISGFAEEGIQNSTTTVVAVENPAVSSSTDTPATPVTVGNEAVRQPAVQPTEVKVATSTEETSQAVPLRTYLVLETENFQKAREERRAAWEKALKAEVDALETMVRNMASDGEVTSPELTRLEKALESYGWARKDANKELALYAIRIAEDERAAVYQELADIYSHNFMGDNKKETIRKFFVNSTGRNVVVKSDKIGRGYISVWTAIFVPLMLLALL